MSNFFHNFLKKAQKYTGTDNVYLAKGGFWLTLGQIVSMAIAFFSAWAFANLLDPATYGNYKYILSLTSILAIFSLDGIRTAVTQATARGLEGSFYTGFRIKLKWGTLGSLAALAIAVYYYLQGNSLFPVALVIAAIFSPLMYASQIYSAFLVGKKLFSVQVNYSVANQIVSAIATIIALFLTKNLFWLIGVYFFTNALLDYFFYFLTKTKFHPNREEDVKSLSYAKHLSLMSVINYIGTYLDKILLFNFMGPAQLAIYSFAILIPEQIKTITGNLNTLALPKLAPKSPDEIKKNMAQKTWKLAILTVTIILLYMLIAPYFFKIFFPQYLGSVAYSQVFMLTLLAFPASLMGTAFSAKMMKKELYLLRFVALSRIILFSVLIPLFGIWGAIWAEIGGEIISLSLTSVLFYRGFKQR